MPQANLDHRLTEMVTRDPDEAHRSATSLELLYDLAFVVAFAQVGEQLAHLLAEGYVSEGIAGFAFAMFAICWAWINFSSFASSFDTNDWLYRVMTMVQMLARACLTVLRETRCSLASWLIDKPLPLASRRILVNSPTLDSITAFHRREKHPDGINGGVGSAETAIINRRAAKWAGLRLQNRFHLKLP